MSPRGACDNSQVNRLLLISLLALSTACGSSDPPPPSPNHKAACDTLSFCRISESGFSCDADKVSGCAQCINGTACNAILAGACSGACPGVTFKPK